MSENIIHVQPATHNLDSLKHSDPNSNIQSSIPAQINPVGVPMKMEQNYNNQFNQSYPPADFHMQPNVYPNSQVNPTIVTNNWMPRPTVPGCPMGLEYLTQIDQLLIHQKVEIAEIITGIEMNNEYVVKNIFGQQIYLAKEETDICIRNICGPNRPFVIHIRDNLNNEVITIRRPYSCNCYGQCLSCSECCQDEVEVEAPPGTIVGYVKQLYESCEVRYAIFNESRQTVLRLHGPNYFQCYCPGDDFPLALFSADGVTKLGRVSKQWSNIVKELFTDADNFGIQFPMDLDVKIKAVIIGSVFLLDFMYFENSNKKQTGHIY